MNQGSRVARKDAYGFLPSMLTATIIPDYNITRITLNFNIRQAIFTSLFNYLICVNVLAPISVTPVLIGVTRAPADQRLISGQAAGNQPCAL